MPILAREVINLTTFHGNSYQRVPLFIPVDPTAKDIRFYPGKPIQ
ncbi:hypothetical protein [Methanobrevibacter sp.]